MKIKSTAMAICFILLASLSFAHTLEVDLIADTDRTWGWVDSLQTNIYELSQYNHYHEIHSVGDVIPTLNDFDDGGAGKYQIWLEGSTLDRNKFQKLFNLFGTRFNTDNNSSTFRVPNLNDRYLVGYKFKNASCGPLNSLKEGTKATLFIQAEIPNIIGWVSTGNVKTFGDGETDVKYLKAFGSSDGNVFKLSDATQGASARWTSGLNGSGYRTFVFDASKASGFYKNGTIPTVQSVKVRYKTWYDFPPETEHIKIVNIKEGGSNQVIKNGRIEVVNGCKYPGLIDWVSPRSTQGVTSRAIYAFLMMNFASNKLHVAQMPAKNPTAVKVTPSTSSLIADDAKQERTAASQEWVDNNYMRKGATIPVELAVGKTSLNPVSSKAVYEFVENTVSNLVLVSLGGNGNLNVDPMKNEIRSTYATITSIQDLENDVKGQSSEMEKRIMELQTQVSELKEQLSKRDEEELIDPQEAMKMELKQYVDNSISTVVSSLSDNATNMIVSAIYLYDAYDENSNGPNKNLPAVYKVFVYKGTLCVKNITSESQELRGLTGKFEANRNTSDMETSNDESPAE